MNLNVLDYTILIILLLSAVIGYRKGLTGTIVEMVSVLLGLLLAFFYCDNGAGFLEEHYNIVTSLSAVLNRKFPMAVPVVNNFLADKFSRTATGIGQPASDLAYWLVMSGCFLVLLLLGGKLFKLLLNNLSGIFTGGALGWFNRLGGMTFAVAKNGLIIVVLLVLVQPLIKFAAQMGLNGAGSFLWGMENSIIFAYVFKIFLLVKAVWL